MRMAALLFWSLSQPSGAGQGELKTDLKIPAEVYSLKSVAASIPPPEEYDDLEPAAVPVHPSFTAALSAIASDEDAATVQKLLDEVSGVFDSFGFMVILIVAGCGRW